jgi:phenylpropionate dioxygenase-like ring-hydroxylating dioxygenase large terminal subunit
MIDDPILINDWYPLARSSALAEDGVLAARLLDEDLVLWRTNGTVAAWQDLCIHRGTRLSLGTVENNCLVCPYHGWTYDQSGRCVHIPAHPEQKPPTKARARGYEARERYGLIWVSLGQPEHDIPPFPEENRQGYRYVLSGPFGPVNATAARIIENFLDVAHLPFVHAGILGDPSQAEIADYQVETGPEGIVAKDVIIYQPNPIGTGAGADVTYTFRVLRPFTAYLVKATSEGSRLAILFPITPHDAMHSTAWFFSAASDSEHLTEAEIDEFQSSILAQDIPIVESQRPELLPLDLQAELHLRSDRTAIAYRTWLKGLGISFGVA